MCTPNANERKNIVRKDMKMNKLRLTNKIENHFYLDFNWKEEVAHLSVSRQAGRHTGHGRIQSYPLVPMIHFLSCTDRIFGMRDIIDAQGIKRLRFAGELRAFGTVPVPFTIHFDRK